MLTLPESKDSGILHFRYLTCLLKRYHIKYVTVFICIKFRLEEKSLRFPANMVFI